ncbi:hypothetical protein RHS04_06711 [Rhizoctonia solani]|uniref:Uncharacterized protein n=1 Tax=Rhizoctonia solani TaxID=456999 RepID=A0A8H7LI95_9AGAM|nr:hypothetical protein RHS04_06711 [Rhizoctonia solani]
MPSAAERVWNAQELQWLIAELMEPIGFRKLVQLSSQYHSKYVADAWRQLTGIGNILAILHPSLDVQALGKGRPEAQIPTIHVLESNRVQRFLLYARHVQSLKMNSNPERFVKWTGLDRLLHLPGLPLGQVPFPNVTHFSINVGSQYRQIELAPIIRLVCNPFLRQIWVAPNRSVDYPRSTPEDTEATITTLANTYAPGSGPQSLAFYPEALTLDVQWRNRFERLFLPMLNSVTYLTISVWLFSVGLLDALAETPLVHLEFQSSPPVPHFDTFPIRHLIFPPTGFAYLKTLLLRNVRLKFARDLLICEQLVSKVEALVVELAQINELDTEEEEEDVLYLGLFQEISAIPSLQELTFASTREDQFPPYELNLAMLEPTLSKRLRVLRLYRVSLPYSALKTLLSRSLNHWERLEVLCIMDHRVTQDELKYLALLPNLTELSINISHKLSVPGVTVTEAVFPNPLTLISQFKFGKPFRRLESQLVVDKIVE